MGIFLGMDDGHLTIYIWTKGQEQGEYNHGNQI